MYWNDSSLLSVSSVFSVVQSFDLALGALVSAAMLGFTEFSPAYGAARKRRCSKSPTRLREVQQ
jgi:hypothetical protein